jgi:hypothetical protein
LSWPALVGLRPNNHSKKQKISGQKVHHTPHLSGVSHGELEEVLATLLVDHPATNTNQSDLVQIFYAIASPDSIN